jgi:tetratricopeptide (TPR) repeat protein
MRHIVPAAPGFTLVAAVLAAALLAAASPVAADPGYAPPPPPPPQSRPGTGTTPGESGDAQSAKLTPRQYAEKLYAQAYDDVQDGKDALKQGKEKNAQKKFSRALDRSLDAVKLDSTYYQAWNLVAFCSRKTGKLQDAFAGYARCLALNPNYDPAHEYRGEAYLMADSLSRAKDELAWLQKHGSDWKTELQEAIAAYEKAHAAAADSTGKK